MVGFVAYDDERMLGTVQRIRTELTDRSGLLHRYRNLPQLTDLDDVEAFASSIGQDGFAGQSAPSVSATLQLAEQLALCGHTQEAVRLTDGALGTANEPVSYTHLDVYKRQSGDRAARISRAMLPRNGTRISRYSQPDRLQSCSLRMFRAMVKMARRRHTTRITRATTIPRALPKTPVFSNQFSFWALSLIHI